MPFMNLGKLQEKVMILLAVKHHPFIFLFSCMWCIIATVKCNIDFINCTFFNRNNSQYLLFIKICGVVCSTSHTRCPETALYIPLADTRTSTANHKLSSELWEEQKAINPLLRLSSLPHSFLSWLDTRSLGGGQSSTYSARKLVPSFICRNHITPFRL